MNYESALDWLYGFSKYGSKLGLERITKLLKHLGNPEQNLHIIHVTGTNGKGSVCKYIGAILTHAGYKTGVFISPHIERFTERMAIDQQEISEEEAARLMQKIKPFVEKMEKDNDTPTFFEIVTAMSFLFFAEQQADYVVVEVGLGGRFDATNVVMPMVSVITNISLEHGNVLGTTFEKIAFEKAGIIKPNISVVTAAKNTALKVIEEVAEKQQAEVILVDCNSWQRLSYSMQQQEFIINGRLSEYKLSTGMLGAYQGENIAVAVFTVEQLQMQGVYLSESDIVAGVSNAFNPGRMELLSEHPLVLLDGAHNPKGMEMLAASLKQDFRYKRLIVVIGILEDKNIKDMLSFLLPNVDVVIITKSLNPRACPPQQLKQMVVQQHFPGELLVDESLKQAIRKGVNRATQQDLVCVTGSLFTVGEARTILLSKTDLKKKIVV